MGVLNITKISFIIDILFSSGSFSALTESFTSGAVDEAGQVALVVSAFERVEDESILTEHLLSLTVDTDVVFVALFFMDVLAITSWALELGCRIGLKG